MASRRYCALLLTFLLSTLFVAAKEAPLAEKAAVPVNDPPASTTQQEPEQKAFLEKANVKVDQDDDEKKALVQETSTENDDDESFLEDDDDESFLEDDDDESFLEDDDDESFLEDEEDSFIEEEENAEDAFLQKEDEDQGERDERVYQSLIQTLKRGDATPSSSEESKNPGDENVVHHSFVHLKQPEEGTTIDQRRQMKFSPNHGGPSNIRPQEPVALVQQEPAEEEAKEEAKVEAKAAEAPKAAEPKAKSAPPVGMSLVVLLALIVITLSGLDL